MRRLHIDIETYSSVDIKACGLYRYVESPDFQILLLTYAYDGKAPVTIDLASTFDGETIPAFLEKDIYDPTIVKVAHNATFERVCLSKHFGKPIPVSQWECTMIKAAYCGLPLGLDAVAEALKLNVRKDTEGKALIKYFSAPCKPTRTNGGRTRNLPEDDPARWEKYKAYNNQDVVVEREIDEVLSLVEWPSSERINYNIDAVINDRGIGIDRELAESATTLDEAHKAVLSARIAELTGLDNPNSAAQMKAWLTEEMGEEVSSLNKDFMKDLIQQAAGSPAEGVLRLRQQLAKSSTAKYTSMLNCRCEDGRARGLFQFYGANRTGRFAGRLIQLQNLPQNHIEPLALARQLIREGDGAAAEAFFGNLSSTLSQLIRTAFIPREGHVLAVADFSAIEARVLAWLAQEQWRMDVFATTGKIYEASAEMMFHQPKGSVDKSSPLRQRGKVAELALGYGGGVNALTTMDKDGSIPEDEKQGIVDAWRAASPAIVALWKDLERCSFGAVGRGGVWTTKNHGIEFRVEGKWLTIKLPNGRKLYYCEPEFTTNRFGSRSIKYKAMDQTTHKWGWTETYSGKFCENLCQAIARDCLCDAMLKMERAGLPIVLHVHDEAAVEVPTDQAEAALKTMLDIMAEPLPWAPGLLLKGEGFITQFYKKD
jgi:DNA polymerase bacteriophage-type